MGELKKMTNKEAHEEASGMALDDFFFAYNNIDPNKEAQDD